MKKLILFSVLLSMTFALVAGGVPTSVQAYPRAFKDFYNWLGSNLNAPATDDIYFVDGNLSSAGDGKTWNTAYRTITAALAQAGDNDIIYIAPGTYEEGDTLEITQDYLKLIGVGSNRNNDNVLIYNTADTTYDLLDIDASGVEIAGISFKTVNDSSDAINLSTLAAETGIWIHDCRFDGNSAGVYGIHTGSTYDASNVLIEYNLFTSFVTAAVYCNSTEGTYANNLLYINASSIGFEHIPTTTARPDQCYIGNVILGANSSDVGIKITNTPSAGLYMIVENRILNCATSITGKATNDAACVLNYVGDASGGALIDPSP